MMHSDRNKKVRVEGNERVLILVLMDDALRHDIHNRDSYTHKAGLNPCFNG